MLVFAWTVARRPGNEDDFFVLRSCCAQSCSEDQKTSCEQRSEASAEAYAVTSVNQKHISPNHHTETWREVVLFR